MKLALRSCLALSFVTASAAAETSGRNVALKASDGTKLAATYYSGEQAGPGILLLHQCNGDRSGWNGLAEALAGRGFHVLTFDYRGYGESGGTPYKELSQSEQLELAKKRPGDVEVAFAYLRSQPGVRDDAFGAGGASCGVNESIQLARRHSEVRSLVLLSGFSSREDRQFLKASRSLPLLLSAADDDGGAVESMGWMDAASGNPKNAVLRYAAGGHGTVMFQAHPDLRGDIVAWYEATLEGKAAPAPKSELPKPAGEAIRLLALTDEPGGTARAAKALAEERVRNPKSAVLEPAFVNRLGYTVIQAGDARSGVAIMQVNVDAHPTSANAWDSLGDALLADGQREKARAAAEKALALVDTDPSESPQRRQLIRDSARQKLDRLKSAPR